MSNALAGSMWEQLRKLRLLMMQYPIGSVERRLLSEDAQQIEMALSAGTPKAG